MEKGRECKKIINIDLDDDENENNAGADAELDASVSAEADIVADYVNDTNHSRLESSHLQPGSGNSNVSNKKNKKITRAVKDILTSNSTKFMSNFDPELSNRERRKLTRKFNVDGKKNASDENGVFNGVEKDTCDCLVEDCPGCHFPCPKCRSCKCGIECRVNRKWMYEIIESEVDFLVGKNSGISTS